LCFLLKGVQNIDSLGESGDIHDTKCSGCVSHAYFSNARTDAVHRLPVVGIEAALNAVELEAGVASRPIGKSP
jgi:hypothetical protein